MKNFIGNFFQALVHSTARKMDLWVIACVPVPEIMPHKFLSRPCPKTMTYKPSRPMLSDTRGLQGIISGTGKWDYQNLNTLTKEREKEDCA